MNTKQCSKCREIKLVDCFSKSKTTKCRLASWCKDCFNERERERRKRKPCVSPKLDGSKQCSYCKEILEINEFCCSSKENDGRSRVCRSCSTKLEMNRRYKFNYQSIDENAILKCSDCGTKKTAKEFNLNRRNKTGRTTNCKLCCRKRQQKTMLKLMYDVLSAYSDGKPKCACCGENTIEFLELDHINGNGKTHREYCGGTHAIYRWARNHNYPKGLQVLCCNCNWAKFRHGVCPHKRLV